MDGRHFFHRGKKKMVAVVAAVCIHCQSFKLKQVGGQGRMGGGPGGGHPEGTRRAGRASISSQQKINGVSVFFYLIGEYYLEIAFDFFFL